MLSFWPQIQDKTTITRGWTLLKSVHAVLPIIYHRPRRHLVVMAAVPAFFAVKAVFSREKSVRNSSSFCVRDKIFCVKISLLIFQFWIGDMKIVIAWGLPCFLRIAAHSAIVLCPKTHFKSTLSLHKAYIIAIPNSHIGTWYCRSKNDTLYES